MALRQTRNPSEDRGKHPARGATRRPSPHANTIDREDCRGRVTDGLEDPQIATAQFLDACIRSDELPVRDRLRAANTFLRHVQSGAFVPASFPGDDPNLLDDDLTGPDFSESDSTGNDSTASDPIASEHPVAAPAPDPDSPYGPVNQATTASETTQNTAQNPTETHRTTVHSATATEQRSDLAHTTRDERSNVAPPPPPTKPRETLLTDAFLAATFLHKHEPRQAFERLLKHQLRAYAPATPQEELLTFRITQKSWILRRLDTLDRVIADSAVTKVREQHPNAAPAACIAMTFLTRNDTEETSFYARIAQQRAEELKRSVDFGHAFHPVA